MKTAVSIPDAIFSKGEKLAKKLHLSRSKLYSQALAEFFNKHYDASISKALNELYSTENSTLDPLLARGQSQAIKPKIPEEW